MVDPAVVCALETAEATVVRDVYEAAIEARVRRLSLATREIGGGVAVRLLPLDFGFFERVIALGVSGPVTDADLDAIVEFYDGAGISESMVQLAPVTAASSIQGGLLARGYVRGRVWSRRMRFLDDARPVPESCGDHRIELVDERTAADYGAICERVFGTSRLTSPLATAVIGRDGWQHYLGRTDHGEPVAVGALRIVGDVAWLGYGATLPDARGHGWQTALLRRRLADAQRAACRMATVETADDASDVSVRNLDRAGFIVAYRRQDWVRRVRLGHRDASDAVAAPPDDPAGDRG